MQVLEWLKEKLGADHLDTLTCMHNLAWTWKELGRWATAEELQVQVLEMCKNKLGVDHSSTLTSMNNLAMMYLVQGRIGCFTRDASSGIKRVQGKSRSRASTTKQVQSCLDVDGVGPRN